MGPVMMFATYGAATENPQRENYGDTAVHRGYTVSILQIISQPNRYWVFFFLLLGLKNKQTRNTV